MQRCPASKVCLLKATEAGINTFNHAYAEPLTEHVAGQFITLLSTVACEEPHVLLLHPANICSLLYALFSSANMHSSRFHLVYMILGACRRCEVSKSERRVLRLLHNILLVVGLCL